METRQVLRRGEIPGWSCAVKAGAESLMIVCSCRGKLDQLDGTWIDGSGLVCTDLSCPHCGRAYPGRTLVLDGYAEYVDEMLQRWGIS